MDRPASPQAPPVDAAIATVRHGGGGSVPPSPGADRASSLVFFRELFDREASYVWTSLRRLGVPDRDLEDLSHEVFVRVYQRLDQYDPSRPIRPWLFAFAVRVAAEDRKRARHRYEQLGSADDASALAVSPEGPASSDAEIIRVALDALDMDKRATVVLHDLDGYSVPEIAQALTIPEGTIYSRLRAARAELTLAVRRLRRREK
jgi:RNA polymerase sigma-70 factor, ECF subfamily